MIAIDGHTHVYSTACPERTLSWGSHNLKQLAESGTCLVFFLCDPAGIDIFSQLQGTADSVCIREGRPGYVISRTMETVSLTISKGGEARVIVIRGQQLVSSENLEILAIGHATNLASGRPLYKTLDAARAAKAHIIVPWGAGKWLGARGRLVSEMLQRETFPGLHLGDNGGRPAMWPVAQFREAAAQGTKVISGSDPLPIAGDDKRIGTYGSAIDRDLDTASPWKSIASFLADPDVRVNTIGSNMSVPKFFRAQSMLRFRAIH